MGYRNYIGKVPRKKYEKIKDLSKEDLFKFLKIENSKYDDYISMRDIGIIELHELGKYCEYSKEEMFSKFFTNDQTNEIFHNSDTEFYLVNGKDILKYIIDDYKNKIMSIYENLLKNYERENLSKLKDIDIFEAFEHLRYMYFEWQNGFSYNIEEDEKITNSWKYEYAIFELVRIYKSIDLKKDVLVYYGY